MNNFNYSGVNINQGFNQSVQYPLSSNDVAYVNGQTYQQKSSQIQNNEIQSNLNNTQFMNSQFSTEANINIPNSTTNMTHDLRCLNSQQSEKNYVEHLDLNTFKIEKCKNIEQHNLYRCPYYHNSFDRRRLKHILSDLCDLGEKCQKENCIKSHNSVEVHYSQDQYKKKFCKSFKAQNNCEYGDFCSFAHCEQDILIDLIHLLEKDEDFYLFHYKTVMCPFIEDHPRDRCEYSHNTQDYRRKPDQFSYEPETCPYWPSKDKIQNYQNGCPDGYNCTKCHGWKELDYHPRVYKTKSCTQCKKLQNCPNYHNPKEKRQLINQTIIKYNKKELKIFEIFLIQNNPNQHISFYKIIKDCPNTIPKNSFYLAMKRQFSNIQPNNQTTNNNSNNLNYNNTNNYIGNMNASSPNTNIVQQYQQINISQFQQQPSHFYFNQNSNLQQQNNNFSNTNSTHLNNNNNRKFSKNSNSQSTNKSGIQINNDQNINQSIFQINSSKQILSDQAQSSSNDSSLLIQKQIQILNPQNQHLSDNYLINTYDSQRNKFSESVNLQNTSDSQQNSNIKSIKQQQQFAGHNTNWVVNENYTYESGDEPIDSSINSRKKSFSEGEINFQMNQLNIDKQNSNQNINQSQNDKQSKEPNDQLNCQKSQSSTKSIERKSLKMIQNKNLYDCKEDKENSNSQASIINQQNEDYKFQSYNSYGSQNNAPNQTSTFNLYQTSDIRSKVIEDIFNGEDE